MPAQGASVVSEKKRGPPQMVESKDLPNLEVSVGLDMMIILK